MLVTSLGVGFALGEQTLGALRELAGQAAVAGLVHEELAVAFLRLLAVEREGLLGGRIEAEQVPVAAVDGLLHLALAVGHAALDAVHLAGSVGDDEGRAGIGFRLGDGLDGLRRVGAHGDLGDVNVAVGHGDLRQALGLDLLAGSRELRDLADVGGLGGLSAGVGVNLGVEDEDVHIFTGSEDVVHAAEADVEGPAVAAEDPAALLVEVILLREDLLGHLAGAAGEMVSPAALAASAAASFSGQTDMSITVSMSDWLQDFSLREQFRRLSGSNTGGRQCWEM